MPNILACCKKWLATGIALTALVMAAGGLSAQSGFRLLFQIPQPAKRIAADKLRQLYVVTPANEVIKYSPEGRVLYRFNNNTLGDLGLIDATDPFNLLLYYPDFQIVLILDRTLNPLGEYNLWEYGLFQPRAVGMANDNLLWVYDEIAFRLKKLNRQGHVVTQSDDLNLLLARPPKPVALMARNNQVYLNDPQAGILLFDNFGQYLRAIPVTGAEHFHTFDDESLWYFSAGYWTRYDLSTLQPDPQPAPPEIAGKSQALFFRERAYVLHDNGIEVWGR